jgi:four helix bundle protein
MDRTELEARTAAFALAVFRVCQPLRREPGLRAFCDQLVDAAGAVGANYRASSRARSRREFAAKIGVVAEEADESVYWLELLANARGAEDAVLSALVTEARELRAIFAASYRTARRSRRTDRRVD